MRSIALILRRARGKLRFLIPGAVLVLAMVAPPSALAQGGQNSRPNIIYILFDDLGFADSGPYGSEIHTPNIDALAGDGIRYNAFETRAICSPTRAALLTGRNNQSVGMMDLATGDRGHAHSRGYITPAAATVAQILQANGYSTSIVGKWHLTPNAEQHDSSSTRANWPSGKGFDNFYGILSGWSDQYRPRGVGRELAEGDHVIPPPDSPDYHFSEAIVDRAIGYLRDGFATNPRQPAYLYLAFVAPHAPVQVWQPYIDKYDAVYQRGWDRIRLERFERQKELGIIPRDAVLPARHPDDPAWDSLTDDEKRVYARFMAAYAGMIEHADEQIGRLVTFLKESGQYENTVIFLMSDNGAAPEAGVDGNLVNPYGDTTSVAGMLARIDEIGGPTTMPLYQRPWAMVGGTPFRMYKLWPYGGGVRDPLIITWPAGIRDRGAIRSQFVETIDITPTVLDILGIEAPGEYAGVPQMEMHGRSILPTFTDPDAPTRSTQFYLMRGNRAIRQGDWRAVAIHRNGTSFNEDRWELFDLSRDFSEAVDLSAQYPEKLAELQALWWAEAEKYGALPLVEFGMGGGGAQAPQR